MEGRNLVNLGEWLLRRGFSTPQRKYLNPDGTATSRVFKLREIDHGELSVDARSLTTYERAITDKNKYVLFEIANQDVHDIGLKSYHAPLPDGSNDAHAVIIGMEKDDDTFPGLLARKSKRIII